MNLASQFIDIAHQRNFTLPEESIVDAISALCLCITAQSLAIEANVKNLGADNFNVRHQTHQAMYKQLHVPWNELLISQLLKKPRQDFEVSRRLEILTKGWDNLLTSYGKFPWIDALPKDFPDRQTIINGYLGKVNAESTHVFRMGRFGGYFDPDWTDYRNTTQLFVANLRAQGWWTYSIRRLQEKMIPNELYWIAHGKYPP